MVQVRPPSNADTIVEAVSKGAALASVAALLVLRVALYPGLGWPFRLLTLAVFIGGWGAGRAWPAGAPASLAFLAPVAPVALAAGLGSFDPVLYTVWIAGLAGCLLPSIRWSGWDLPASWRVLLGGWALTLSLAWPVLVGREIGFDLQRFADVSNANSWAQMPAPLVAGWIVHVVLLQLVGLLWLEWMIRRSAAVSEATVPLAVHGLWMGATVSSVVAIYQGTVDLGFLSSLEWADRGRATGLMLDANSFGMIAALAGPIAVVAIRPLALRAASVLAAAAFAVNWAGVWLSGSRTAFLCGLVGTCALAVTMLRPARWRSAVMWPAVAVVLVMVVAAGVLSTTSGPLEREIGNPNDATVTGALFNRGGYGDIAARMIQEYPLTGVGAGTYHWLASDYQRLMLDQELAFDNAQNWWRHQTAELGLLGGLPLLLWSALLVRMTLWRGGGQPQPGAGTYRGLLLGLGLVSLLGMPTQNPTVLLWFFALAALLAVRGDVPEGGAAFSPRIARARWAVVAALAVLYTSGHALLAVGDLSVTARAVRANRDYAVGVYAPEPDPEGGQFRWTAGHAELTFAADTRWLVLRARVQHPDLEARPVELRFSTPCQVVQAQVVATGSPVTIALVLPEPALLRLSVDVSRTWSPSDYGSPDSRELGAVLVTEFVDSLEEATATTDRRIPIAPCRAGVP